MRKKKPLHIYIRDCNFPLKEHCARYFFPRPDTEIGKKSEFFGETLCAWKSLSGKFFGASTHWSLRTQDSGLGDRASISKL